MRKNYLIALVALASAGLIGATALSCSSTKCGSMTYDKSGTCIGTAAPQCGPGTIPSGGECITQPDPCGANTTWDGDAGQCIGQSSGPPTQDGGPALPTQAMRWTKFLLNNPVAIQTVANLQLPDYILNGDIVIIMASAGTPGAPDYAVYGGSGAKTADSPLTYSFQNAFGYGPTHPLPFTDPVPAIANGVTGNGEAGYSTSPAAGDSFDWAFLFLPGQPVLDVRNVTFTFSTGPDGLIKSDMNGGMYGSFSGCFTRPSADALYISALSQTLGQLLDQDGAAKDCDPEGGSDLTGYILAANWEADEQVVLDWGAGPTPDGGTPPNDAAVSD